MKPRNTNSEEKPDWNLQTERRWGAPELCKGNYTPGYLGIGFLCQELQPVAPSFRPRQTR